MNYEKKYKEALERAKEQYNKRTPLYDIGSIFPELKESEEERIRKAIKKALQVRCDGSRIISDEPVTLEEAIAWLEKQGNKSVNIDVESMISSYEQRLKSQGGTKYSPLVNMCLTAFRHGVENVLEELNLKKLEKQGGQKHFSDFKAKDWYVSKVDGKIYNMTYNPADKISPKFKVGDWIVTDVPFGKIVRHVDEISSNIIDERYGVSDEYGLIYNISFDKERKWHKWTIQDAMDGDVLATENFIFIFKNIDDGNGVHYYCQYEISKHEDDNQFDIALPQSLMGRVGNSISHYSPATKEQRDLLFQKMKEAGYEWNSEKKEVKKIEVVSKESEDEQMIERLKSCIYASDLTTEGRNELIAWLEKQGEQMTKPKFKVGDRVVINCREEFYTTYNGKEGTIIDIFDLEKNHWGNIVVEIDNGMRSTFYTSELIKK